MDYISEGMFAFNEITLNKEFSFSDFKKTKYYNNQDNKREIKLGNIQIFENHKFIVTIRFDDDLLSLITLYCIDDNINLDFEHESERKKIHDLILKEWGVQKKYNWGLIESIYEPRSNAALILIEYSR